MAGRFVRRCGAAALALAVLIGTAGCEGEKVDDPPEKTAAAKQTLSWDLRQGHTLDQVRWPGRTTVFELRGGVRVRLLLPGNATFDERVEKVSGRRDDRVVRRIDLFYPEATTGEAYRLAQRLGRRWGVDLRNIDAWYKRRSDQSKAGKEDFSDTAFTGDPHSRPLGGPTGPAPAIEVLNSFDDKRPVVVSLAFVWPR